MEAIFRKISAITLGHNIKVQKKETDFSQQKSQEALLEGGL